MLASCEIGDHGPEPTCVDPQLLTWASYSTIQYTGGNGGNTYSAFTDLTTLKSTLVDVTNVHHDMFCPGEPLLLLPVGRGLTCDTPLHSPERLPARAVPVQSPTWLSGSRLPLCAHRAKYDTTLDVRAMTLPSVSVSLGAIQCCRGIIQQRCTLCRDLRTCGAHT